jgi:hypothetical protein
VRIGFVEKKGDYRLTALGEEALREQIEEVRKYPLTTYEDGYQYTREPVHNVLGRFLTASDVEDIFGVRAADFNRRINDWGVSPSDAILVPREKLKAMSVPDRLMSGWKYWNDSFGTPLTETDLLVQGPITSITQSIWFPRGSGNYLVQRVSGMRSVAWALRTYHDNPRAVLSAWLLAAIRHLDLGSLRLGDPNWRKVQDFTYEYVHPDSRAKHMIPDDGLVRLSEIYECAVQKGNSSGSQDRIKSWLLFLKVVATLRKSTRDKYQLLDDPKDRERAREDDKERDRYDSMGLPKNRR